MNIYIQYGAQILISFKYSRAKLVQRATTNQNREHNKKNIWKSPRQARFQELSEVNVKTDYETLSLKIKEILVIHA